MEDYKEKLRLAKEAFKVEPKFKVGDWVTNGINFTFQVRSIEDNMYLRSDEYFIDIETADKTFRLWTIQDAKDGDVLVIESGRRNDECLFIFKDIACREVLEHCYYRTIDNTFSPTGSYIGYLDNNYHPATKEHRDLLFSKMKEEGYEWDAEKKELKKIEQKPTEDEDREIVMKANEAPEKIYINSNLEDRTWLIGKGDTSFIEYTHTDTFIEKACEFLKSYCQDTYDGMGYIAGIVNDKTIEDFKKYMKGE